MAQQLEHQQSNSENRLSTERAYDVDMSRPSSPAGSIELLPSREPSPPPSDSAEGQEQTPLDAVRAVKIEYHRKLTWWDVAALIINKMIGTGIFSGPPTVLLYTGKKSTALWLWAAGFVYTLIRYARVSDCLLEVALLLIWKYLSMMFYLEYSRKLPYTGGELVYVRGPLSLCFSHES